jgi:pimeloyl-ACP methyl ester carboxylesterase
VLYVAPDHAEPTVVFVHRLYGDRQELSPLVERLRKAKHRYSLLAFDLAGRGNSKLPEKSKLDDVGRLTKDVRAALRRAEEATDQSTRGFVLVGSSLGATLVSKVAFDEPKVLALALVSPGAAISGMDIYEPYAEVRTLPTFLGGSVNDPVSREPLDALVKMAKNATVKRYPGALHSAGHIGHENPALWDDLTAWLMSVFDAKAQPRGPRQYPHAGGAR